MFVKEAKTDTSRRYYLAKNIRDGEKRTMRLLYSYGDEKPVYYQPRLYRALCENKLKDIEEHSVDLIIDDPPYGKTKQEWDTEPDWDDLTHLYDRVLSKEGLVVIFGQQPSLIPVYQAFTGDGFQFRYELTWKKKNPAWVSPAQPKPAHENIFIFAKKGVNATDTTFNTEAVMEDASFVCANCREERQRRSYSVTQTETSQQHKGEQTTGHKSTGDDKRYPKSVLEYQEAHPAMTDDPKTDIVGQKPVKLLRWLIMALSNRGDTVLDPHAGSGSTLYAAIPLCRESIGIEVDAHRFESSKERLEQRFEKLTGLKHAKAVWRIQGEN